MTSTTLSAPTTTDLAGLLERRRPGHPLESAFYTSPEVFDADVRAVLARTWLFVATEAEVREPGDYLTVEIGPHSVIVLRDDDEANLRQLLPSAQVVHFDEAGHSIQGDMPIELAATIQSFIP